MRREGEGKGGGKTWIQLRDLGPTLRPLAEGPGEMGNTSSIQNVVDVTAGSVQLSLRSDLDFVLVEAVEEPSNRNTHYGNACTVYISCICSLLSWLSTWDPRRIWVLSVVSHYYTSSNCRNRTSKETACKLFF